MKTKIQTRIVWLAVLIATQLAFLAVWPAGSSAQPIQAWKFAVLCDTRGDSDWGNARKSGLNEAVVASAATDIVKEGASFVIVPGDLVNGYNYILTPYAKQFASWRAAMAPVYNAGIKVYPCLLYTSPSPRDGLLSRMPSS